MEIHSLIELAQEHKTSNPFKHAYRPVMNFTNTGITKGDFIYTSLTHAMKQNVRQIKVHKSLSLITMTAS